MRLYSVRKACPAALTVGQRKELNLSAFYFLPPFRGFFLCARDFFPSKEPSLQTSKVLKTSNGIRLPSGSLGWNEDTAYAWVEKASKHGEAVSRDLRVNPHTGS